MKLKTAVSSTTVRYVYVRAGNDVKISNVAPGAYVLQFATGRDWDTDARAFRRDRSFAAFDRDLSFSEQELGDRIRYLGHEVTLHAVPNGNVGKKGISAAEFSDDVGAGRGGS